MESTAIRSSRSAIIDVDGAIVPYGIPWWHIKHIKYYSVQRTDIPTEFGQATFDMPGRKFVWLSIDDCHRNYHEDFQLLKIFPASGNADYMAVVYG